MDWEVTKELFTLAGNILQELIPFRFIEQMILDTLYKLCLCVGWRESPRAYAPLLHSLNILLVMSNVFLLAAACTLGAVPNE